MINIVDKSKCCGCNACEDICPVEAITFSEDKEGFLYPNVDLDRCIDCELCDKLCPMDKVEDLKINDLSEPECYAAIHKNLEIRFDSTSGGIFSALATKMFKEGGYVGGAVYDNNWGVKQLITNDSSKLVDLRSSKYIQSDSRGFYVQLEDILNKGEKVLVCGLPCQIFAIKSFLRKPYDNLILVDLICRYINSPKAYRKYLNSLEKEYGGKVVYIKAKIRNWVGIS
jgi:Coenzyme F420-reducing hydrogenase, beta subunit